MSMALLQVLARTRSHSSGGSSTHMAHMAQLGVIPLLAHVLLYGAPALRGRAAAALCNLSLEDKFVVRMDAAFRHNGDIRISCLRSRMWGVW